MDTIERYEVYFALCGGSNALESISLAEDTGVKIKVDSLFDAGFTKNEILNIFENRKSETRGRKEKVIKNHLSGDMCDIEVDAICPKRSEDIEGLIIGVCRSFATDSDELRRGLNYKKLKRVLSIGDITVKNIMGVILVGERQARRYMKAAEIVIKLDAGKLEQ